MRTSNCLLFRLRLFGVTCLALLFAGCSSTGVSISKKPLTDTSTSAAGTASEIVRPSKPARVETDEELGFTITELVRISGDVRDSYNEALRLLESGNTSAGITALEKVVAQAPELTAPYIDLGIAYRNSGDIKKAEKNLQHALKLTPDHPVAHNELGIVYRNSGRFQLARQSYEKALAILPDFHYAQRNLGVICDLFLQDLHCALQNYQSYQQIFPDDRDVAIWIADLQNRLPATE